MADKLIDQQWIDIVLPPPPESNILLWWLLGFALFVLGMIIVFIWYQQPHRILLRLLRETLRQLDYTRDYKQLLIKVEHALCRYHHLPYLYPAARVPAHWHYFFRQLTAYRYQRGQPSLAQTQELLHTGLGALVRSDKQHVG